MPMTPKEMMKLLEANGFVCVRTNGSHHMYKNPETGRATTVPRHSKDLKKGMEHQILKQAGLK